MPQITRALLRKRSEHNEGMISTLEELTLHQEELESINEVLGMSCRKLKILYLQNNIINKMENLHHLKDLEYLNMALNNVQKIEGLQNCEFLHKIDLTINFIDLDELKSSIDHLSDRKNLTDLYMMGNPCQANWDKFTSYVIARLPQITTLDGTEITRSMQIQARQQLPKLEAELEQLASRVRIEKAIKKAAEPPKAAAPTAAPRRVVELDEDGNEIPGDDNEVTVEDVDNEEGEGEGDNELTENTPEARIKIYQELAQQKKEKEDRAKVNAPKERDYEKEQVQSVAQIREKEAALADGTEEIKQRNEGGWEFFWDEESRPGHVLLDVHVARHLDSSLIDVDVHPHYVSIVVKSKVLRLRLPAEVKVSESKCQRSKVTGSLVVIMPKVNGKANEVTIRGDIKARSKAQEAVAATAVPSGDRTDRLNDNSKTKAMGRNASTTVRPKKLSLHEQMIQEAMSAGATNSSGSSDNSKSSASLLDSDIGAGAVRGSAADTKSVNTAQLRNIVRKPHGDGDGSTSTVGADRDLFELDAVFAASNRVTELD